MRKLRHSQRLRGLALFTLALQFVLAFGHTHMASAGSIACRALPVAAHQSCPATPDDDRDCPICQAVTMTGMAVATAPPAIAVPASPNIVVSVAAEYAIVARTVTGSFDARGPPAFEL